MSTILITEAKIYGEELTDVLIKDDLIYRLGSQAKSEARICKETEEVTEISARGAILLPGLVDLHTHLREPGGEAGESVDTGTQAAAMGGFTAVHAMANTNPVADNAGVIEQVYQRGIESGYCDVYPIGAVTEKLEGTKLSQLGAMANSKAKVRVFSDDGKCVSDSLLMRRALEYVKQFDAVIAQHAQDPALTLGAQMHEGVVSAEIGLRGWPAVAEEAIIARDVLLAQHLDSRLHVCHLSTAGSVEIIRAAKERGVKVSAEVTPHHLILTHELARNYDAKFKVNPPLRTEADVLAVQAGLADGTIDIVATDHAPHPADTKDTEWDNAAFGMTGLETALNIVQKTMVDSNKISWRDVARIMSERPAEIGRDSEQGRPIKSGEIANLLLWDPNHLQVVDPRLHRSRSRNSPFAGMELPGKNLATIYRGKLTVLDGKLVDFRKQQ